jgi:hypothetical protein
MLKQNKRVSSLVLLAMTATLLQPSALVSAAEPAILDVSLHESGTLYGRIVDQQQRPIPQRRVEVQAPLGGVALTSATTDRNGWFRVNGMRGGVYRIAAANDSGVIRAWAPDTAPPTAHQAVQMVANNGQAKYGGDLQVRGQGMKWGKVAMYGLGIGVVTWAIVEVTKSGS